MLIASTNYPETRHALGLKTAGARDLLLLRAIANSILVLSAKRPANKNITRFFKGVSTERGGHFVLRSVCTYVCVCVCSRQEQEVCARAFVPERVNCVGESNCSNSSTLSSFPCASLLFHLASVLLCAMDGYVSFQCLIFLLRAFSAVLVLNCLHYCV